ncbi:hypothetical protein SteCoe_10551 [Stentor coeruleus]|uniref:Uncharacterized protein n=1 Tax=Stentor coeruleus TaxID=5963 RepID=A0A1R2CFA2_9CILI|nr:hypothetical protein SteCoe_10551 [Stentor coeruleus]
MEDFLRLFPYLVFVFLLIWAMITYVIPQVRRYRRRSQLLDEIDEKYESLRRMRRDLIYHIDWARERGEYTRANELEPEIDRIDQELEELRIKFNEANNGKGDLNKIH